MAVINYTSQQLLRARHLLSTWVSLANVLSISEFYIYIYS